MEKRLLFFVLGMCFLMAGCQKKEIAKQKITTMEETKKETSSQVSSTASKDEVKQKKEKVRIAIDAGHQKKQMTSQEPIGPGASKTKPAVSSGTEGVVTKKPEYEVTLELALKLKKELQSRGYDVYMIRETNDVTLSNRDRAEMANRSGATLFLRIHCNSAEDASVHGALTMCPGDSNPYCTKSVIANSVRLAKDVGNGLSQKSGAKNRGMIKTDEMSGINWCKIPVTIVETGFMSNPEEDQKLSDSNYQKLLVQGIADGVDQYMNHK